MHKEEWQCYAAERRGKRGGDDDHVDFVVMSSCVG